MYFHECVILLQIKNVAKGLESPIITPVNTVQEMSLHEKGWDHPIMNSAYLWQKLGQSQTWKK